MSDRTKRPVAVTIMAVLAALLMLKDGVDLFLNPLEKEVQVWFGYRFEGMTAKFLTIPHLLIYG